MLDESSLASTRQMRAFLEKLNPDDRVLVIGDTRQHQGVDAGRPFQQMQEAGMQTSQLDRIMRQKDPELLKAVQHLASNETEKGIAIAWQSRAECLRLQTVRIVSKRSPKTMPHGQKTRSSFPPTIRAANRSTKPYAPSCCRTARWPTTANSSARSPTAPT